MISQPPAYAKQQYGQPKQRPTVKLTKIPVIAGILLIMGGIFGLIWTTWDDIVEASTSGNYLPDMLNLVIAIGAIAIIFDIIATIGGVRATKRKSWGFALTGSIFGLIGGIFSFGLTSSMLALIALILIAISKNEFKSQKT